ncbi:MAG: FAD:protein FMN transferase [Verrucomicrobiales bacterium]
MTQRENARRTSRRRFLTIAGLAGVSAVTVGCLRKSTLPAWTWNGILFGADVSISLHGMPSEQRARSLSEQCFREMRRLERMFSLYLPDSAICRLNTHGLLRKCPAEFIALVKESLRLNKLTRGAFDITVQALWKTMDEHDYCIGPPSDTLLSAALSKVSSDHVRIDNDTISFGQPGMAMTLNGIAQGFITDRVADLLRDQGVERSLVNMGEYRAIGHHPEGRAWNLGIREPGASFGGALLDSVPLEEDRALAVSGGYGYTFDPNRKHHHLLHPQTGENMPTDRSVVVVAPTATIADALSTACAVLDDEAAHSISRDLNCELRIYREIT